MNGDLFENADLFLIRQNAAAMMPLHLPPNHFAAQCERFLEYVSADRTVLEIGTFRPYTVRELDEAAFGASLS
jgi:hypothetical protein